MTSRILVTSGPTRAYIDRIRYIANTSSGLLGARIVETLADAGFAVTHLYGSGSKTAKGSHRGLVTAVEVTTVDDLIRAVERECSKKDIVAVVHAMAVLDYCPENRIAEKKKSGDDTWTIHLVRTPKVSPILRNKLPEAYFIGFKLEAGVDDEILISRALESLEKYGLDAVVANDLEKVSEKFHEAIVVGSDGAVIGKANTKGEIAALVTGLIKEHIEG